MVTRVVICGSRTWRAWDPIKKCMSALQERYGADLVIVTGECKGADMLARSWCVPCGIEHELHEADWEGLGNEAGPARNREMIALDPVAVYAFKDDFDWTLARGRNGGHTEGTILLAVEALTPAHVYGNGKWRSATLVHKLTDKKIAALVSTAAGRERARLAIASEGLRTWNRQPIFQALTDAETAAGENS